MTNNDLIKHWVETSDEDFDVAEAMFKSKKYTWCLFIGHLVIEKLMKAIFIKVNDNPDPPKIHNLIRLAELCKMELGEEQRRAFNVINTFNIDARYTAIKYEFSKRCTKEYTHEQFTKIKEIRQWLKSILTSK